MGSINIDNKRNDNRKFKSIQVSLDLETLDHLATLSFRHMDRVNISAAIRHLAVQSIKDYAARNIPNDAKLLRTRRNNIKPITTTKDEDLL